MACQIRRDHTMTVPQFAQQRQHTFPVQKHGVQNNDFGIRWISKILYFHKESFLSISFTSVKELQHALRYSAGERPVFRRKISAKRLGF